MNFKYRMNFKQLLLCLITTGYALSSSALLAFQPLQPPHEYQRVSKELLMTLERVHYNRPIIDDAISAKAFDYYINSLDPTKSFFLQSDIDHLSQYKYQLDDALRNADVQIAYTIYNLYIERLEKRLTHLKANVADLVSQFDYEIDESLNVDPDLLEWASTEEELDEYWRKRLKNRALTLKLNGESDEKIISMIQRRYKNQLRQVDQTNAVDVFQTFANAVTLALDPHSGYLAPRASETFNINMSLSLEGIGAVLQMDDDYTKVVRLVPGGPAATQTDLAPNDRIIAVGQEGEPMVDVVGMRLDDVVDMIRGERDTTVLLEVVPSLGDSQTSKQISIVRKTVKLEDQSAKKEIVKIKREGQEFKVGVITLPTFYSDFTAIQAGDKNFKSSTRDTKQLIEELKEEDISALVLDLRNNGGGSLQEANSLTGLFIPSGPTVQIRDQSGRVTPLGDSDPSIAYSGPLAVLVNRMSASASEIVAGALQDYGRALIVGDQTFGKGTVQVLQQLDKGQLKVTQAKFYRVSGESTQHRGVIPDIIFPSLIDKDTVGESALENPLPWDKIHEIRYPVYWNIPAYVPILEPRHQARMAKDPNFVAINAQLEAFKKQAELHKSISLQKSTRLQQREDSRNQDLQRENTRREALGMALLTSVEEIEPISEDTYAKEAAEILLDFIATNQIAQQQSQKERATKQTAQK